MQETVIIAATVLASFWGALILQKAALEKLFRIMDAERRARQ